ncbi:MAG: hypothetical protein MJ116_07195 [Lachnospiraceae bacterium]|nr:hypothetical protein [Lachnospiraceae bacterium]
MLNEVLSRIDLIVSCQGSRKISRENLEFMFEKYELSQEDREKVLESCKEKHIVVFRESKDSDLPVRTVDRGEAKENSAEQQAASGSDDSANAEKPAKKGFFKKLFGKA